MAGKTWILENGDLDEVYCNNCGYATRQFLFSFNENRKIDGIFPGECPSCKSIMDHFLIHDGSVLNSLKNALDKNNGKYSPNPLLMEE